MRIEKIVDDYSNRLIDMNPEMDVSDFVQKIYDIDPSNGKYCRWLLDTYLDGKQYAPDGLLNIPKRILDEEILEYGIWNIKNQHESSF